MSKFIRPGYALLLAMILATCRDSQYVIPEPHGLKLSALPTSFNAPTFQPDGGHYAELLLRNGHWHALVDGKPATALEDEHQLHGFLKSFRHREHQQGRPALVLISADGHIPLSQISIQIQCVARAGIDKCHFHVRPSSDGRQKSSSYHALAMGFPCPHCQVMNHNEKIKPLVISIKENGSIQQEIDDSLTLLDDSQATSDLPGLDAKLRNYAERVRGENAAPVVSILVNDTTPYQRFIDVLSRLQNHGLEVLTSALVDWWETEGSNPESQK